ncbi:MAG: signal peptidase II [Blastocatellia bacterium]|nr:signal peptidase II [Blastocatellia bacterium]
MRAKLPYLILALFLVVADQATKAWATLKLRPVMTIEVLPGYFRFSYATNRGVAFSMFAESSLNVRWIFAVISIFAAVFVLNYLWRTAAWQRRANLALGLLLAGIVGNMIDRIRLGEVVDFIEVHWRDQYVWPTFNVADSAICVGAVLLAIEMIWEARANPAPAATE